MSITAIAKSCYSIITKIGAFMSGPIERWLYSDNKILQDIIVYNRGVQYSENSGIPHVTVYLNVYNRTYYSKIRINPASFDVNQMFALKNEGAIILDKDFTALRFESNLSQAEMLKLKEVYALQLKNQGRGQLSCSVTLPVECDSRRIDKAVSFDNVKIEGI